MENIFIQNIPLEYFVVLSSFMFCLGVLGVLLRRNAIIVLGCIELMLNAVNLLLVAFSAYRGDVEGQILVFFIMVVAAAEVAIGLAIIMMMYRNKRSVDVEIFNKLKG